MKKPGIILSLFLLFFLSMNAINAGAEAQNSGAGGSSFKPITIVPALKTTVDQTQRIVTPQQPYLQPQSGQNMQLNPYVACKYPTEYHEPYTESYCDQGCMDRHYLCRGGKWKADDPLLEMHCNFHDIMCDKDPGLYVKGCPVFSEYLLEGCEGQ